MNDRDPSDQALDAANALLEVIGPTETQQILLEVMDERADPEPVLSFERFQELKRAVVATPASIERFLAAMPEVCRRHDLYAEHPEIAERLAPRGRSDPGGEAGSVSQP